MAVPVLTPQTNPVPEPAVAIVLLLLLQVPPGVGSANDVQAPTHTSDAPMIADGDGVTVTTVVTEQAVPNE
jgi:hypothetical protein